MRRPSSTSQNEPSARGLAGLATREALALVAVVVGVVPFLLLLLLVQREWSPLAALDGDVAAQLNEVVSRSPLLVDVLRVVTDLGGNVVVIYAFVLGVAFLLVRRQRRLAAYLAVTGIGIGILVPLTKFLIGRTRPDVAIPVVNLPSNASFPSGHSALSLVTYGALVLVVLPYLRPRARPWLVAGAALVVVAVGFTRLALGVHFVTDVLSGWALGAAWLVATTAVFRGWEHDKGIATPPLTQGVDRVEDDLHPSAAPEPVLPSGWSTVTRVAAVAAAIFAVLAALGLLVKGPLMHTAFGALELAVVVALVELRGDTLTTVAQAVDRLSGTPAVIGVSLATAVLAVAALNRWRPAVFVATSVLGEVLLYFFVTLVVNRSRPPVPDLTSALPAGGSWPSGHVAAAFAVYGSLAAIVLVHSRGRWRWALLALPVLVAAPVAVARLYTAAHYPTDVLAGAVLGATWTYACARLILLPQRHRLLSAAPWPSEEREAQRDRSAR